jgi:MFS family permease
MGPFLFAAAAMFTAMYSTQAILPELGRDFSVAPSQTGLTVSVVIGALAVGAWFWGPLSDRIGRRTSLVLASGALVVPSVGVALAPSFAVLLAMRAAQGLCMPGLLTVGVPYVTEAFHDRIGSRAMGLYVSALVVEGSSAGWVSPCSRPPPRGASRWERWRRCRWRRRSSCAARCRPRPRGRRRPACRRPPCAGCWPTAGWWPPA